MIVPIIFTFDPLLENLSQSWFFYKGLTISKKSNCPIIAQECYFNCFDKQKALFPHFFTEDYASTFGYNIPTEQDIASVYSIVIPSDIEKRRIEESGSQSDAYVDSFVNAWPELEEYICNEVQKYEKTHDKIRGFMCLTHLEFVQNIADKLGKPVFYFEWSTFRYSVYRNAAYFDLNKSYRNYYDRYLTFLNELKMNKLPILTRKEILALFLRDEYLDYLNKSFSEDIYEVGIAGTYNNIVESRAYTNYDILEEVNRAKSKFVDGAVVARYHPGDPLKAKLNCENYQEGVLLDFIFKCRRIMSINSNTEYEAMLCGKPVYDESGYTRYAGFVNDNLNDLADKVVDLEAVNFLAFAVFVPFELINCKEYLEYRLTFPSDIELYMYHLKYYLKCFGMEESVFEGDKAGIYDAILEARKIPIRGKNDMVIIDNVDCNSEVFRLINEKKQLIIHNDELKKELEECRRLIDECKADKLRIEDEIERINNSRSMKVVKVLRKLKNIIK